MGHLAYLFPINYKHDNKRKCNIFGEGYEKLYSTKGEKYTVIYLLITSGILILHHIFQMLVRSSIPLRYKAAYMTVYRSMLYLLTESLTSFPLLNTISVYLKVLLL